MTAIDRWSVLVTVDDLPLDGRDALFDVICEAVAEFEEKSDIHIDVSGQPLKDLGLPNDY